LGAQTYHFLQFMFSIAPWVAGVAVLFLVFVAWRKIARHATARVRGSRKESTFDEYRRTCRWRLGMPLHVPRPIKIKKGRDGGFKAKINGRWTGWHPNMAALDATIRRRTGR